MSRFERTQYFERLIELHLAYAMRDDEDQTSVMTIAEAIAWAESELAVTSNADQRSDPHA